MSRSKSVLSGGVRTADLAVLGMLVEHIPSADVQAAVKQAGRESKRDRLLPAEFLVLYVVSLSLYRDVSYEEVLSCVLEGWRWLGLGEHKIATKGAVTQARIRLGAQTLRLLFERLAQPLAQAKTKGAWYRSRRLVAIDGLTLTVPDSMKNAEAFGYAVDPNYASYPLIRYLCLSETGTHAPLAACMGPYATGELTLVRQIIPSFKPGMLVLADRRFVNYKLWEECLPTGADLLWRAPSYLGLKKGKVLEDGSWLSFLKPRDLERPELNRVVRVVQYTVEGSDETYRLVTNILDPKEAPAIELAQLYTQRWEIESSFDEMKTHLRGARMLLRSKVPELVEQEFWGLLIAYRAIRSLMHEAALAHNKDPDEVSFVSTVRIVRRTLPQRAAFSPSTAATHALEA